MTNERKMQHNKPGAKVRLKTADLMAWRARKHFTQVEAAAFIGVSKQTYHNAEHGRTLLLLSAASIAKAIRVPLDQLKER